MTDKKQKSSNIGGWILLILLISAIACSVYGCRNDIVYNNKLGPYPLVDSLPTRLAITSLSVYDQHNRPVHDCFTEEGGHVNVVDQENGMVLVEYQFPHPTDSRCPNGHRDAFTIKSWNQTYLDHREEIEQRTATGTLFGRNPQ